MRRTKLVPSRRNQAGSSSVGIVPEVGGDNLVDEVADTLVDEFANNLIT